MNVKACYNRSHTTREGTEALIDELKYRGETGDLLAAIFAERLEEAEFEHHYAVNVAYISGELRQIANKRLEILNDAHALGIALLIRREA